VEAARQLQIRVLVKLLLGQWTNLAGPGIMSNSHLGFFTEWMARGLFQIAGYTDIRWMYPRRNLHVREQERALSALTGGLLAGLL